MKKARKFLVLALGMLDAVVAVTKWRCAALLLLINSIVLLCLIVCSVKNDTTHTVSDNDDAPNEDDEQVYGEWIEDDYSYFHCSQCGYEHDSPEYVTPYCPHCGACMEDYDF